MAEKPTYEELEKSEPEHHLTEQTTRLIQFCINRARDEIIWLNRGTKIVYANDAACNFLGYSRNELLSMKLDQIDPDFKSADWDRRLTELHQIKSHRFEARHRTKDGRIFPVEVVSSFMIFEEEEGCLSVIRDITERKQAEIALKKSEEKYRSMMEAMKDAVYICSPEFKRIEYMNPAMITRVGRDLTGEFCHKAIYKNDTKCTWCIFDQIKKMKSVEYEMENPVNKRSYSIINFPIERSNGSISKLTISRDITEVKTIKEQLHHAQKMESIGALAGGIAHDFNNILSGVFGYAQLAKLNLDDSVKTKENIDQIIAGAQRATDLVQQILTLSRQTEHEKNSIRLDLIVKEAIKFLRSSIPTTIEIKLKILSRAFVLADPTQIHQIIMNLCTNAFHAMRKKGGILSVDLKKLEISKPNSIPGLNILPGTYLKLEVKDTGLGMNPKTLKKIFEPYFTTKEIGEGTGLGLAVVLGIVEEHNGYVKAYSELGRGSIFDVYLPVIDKQIDSQPSKKEEDVPGGIEKIMVVDDEESILSSIQALLNDYGYSVSIFSNGFHANEAFKKNPSYYDLIITDMTMPKMTGNDFSSRAIKIRNDIPIILCTGYSDNISEKRAMEIGIKKYLQKPVDSKELLTVIREVLDRK